MKAALASQSTNLSYMQLNIAVFHWFSISWSVSCRNQLVEHQSNTTTVNHVCSLNLLIETIRLPSLHRVWMKYVVFQESYGEQMNINEMTNIKTNQCVYSIQNSHGSSHWLITILHIKEFIRLNKQLHLLIEMC